MYKLDLSERTKKANLGDDFGVFTIRPLGAGEELELNTLARELERKNDELKALEGKTDEDFTDDDKNLLTEASDLALANRTRSLEIMKSAFSSETDGAVDKLFAQVDILTIRKIYDGALGNG